MMWTGSTVVLFIVYTIIIFYIGSYYGKLGYLGEKKTEEVSKPCNSTIKEKQLNPAPAIDSKNINCVTAEAATIDGFLSKSPLRKKEYEIAFLVRQDLKMGKGKIASQVAHAAVSAYKKGMARRQAETYAWSVSGSKKIVLKVESEDVLLSIINSAKLANIPAGYTKDAGRTQIDPGSITVGYLGPDTCENIDPLTRKLKLL